MRGSCRCGTSHGALLVPSPGNQIEATYDYVDESGTLLFQVVRKAGKQFRQRRPDGAGGWDWKLGNTRRVPYRLPLIQNDTSGRPVYVVEGEKDVGTLEVRGHLATCNPGGAGKWSAVAETARTMLDGRDVVVIADRDEVGRKHAAAIAASLAGFALTLVVLQAPEPHKDVSDLLMAGGALTDLVPVEEPEPTDDLPCFGPPEDDDGIPSDPPPTHPADGTLSLFEMDLEPPSIEDLIEASPRCTDSANADAIVREHGAGYRYCVEWELWLSWNGKRWEFGPEARGRVENAAAMTARLEHFRTKAVLEEVDKHLKDLLLDALRDADKIKKLEDERARLLKVLRWHEQSQNASRIDAAVKILRTRLVVHLAELDSNPWLFNVANGTIDLTTASLRPHDRDDLITQISNVEWYDGATCPTWDGFVTGVMGGNRELAIYLQRLIGYAMTGTTREHILAFFYGTGLNGKSTFMSTIRTMFGDYACAAARDLLFEDKHGHRHPEELARLYGKRMVVCAEIGEHNSFDEAKVKDLTGGDVVSCRRMRENSWDLVPTHTLFISGNHKPVVKGDDIGIWRRIRLVPWTVTVTEVDKDLGEKLKRELPGILRWAVVGCFEWLEHGLAEPEAVRTATADYRSESDVLGEFLGAHVVFEKEGRVSRKTLRERYEEWCKDAGHMPLGARKVAQRLREKGVTGIPVRDGARVVDGWQGCRMRTDYDSPTHLRLVGPT
jgi:putative DNA primase/helicase